MKAVLAACICFHSAHLDADDYQARCRAHAFLAATLPLSSQYLLAAKPRSAEFAARRAALLRLHRQQFTAWKAPWLESEMGILPWVDARNPSGSFFVEHYLHWLAVAREKSGVYQSGSPNWPNYRNATRLWLHEQLMDGARPESLLATLRAMAKYENDWIGQNGKSYEPNLKLTQFK